MSRRASASPGPGEPEDEDPASGRQESPPAGEAAEPTAAFRASAPLPSPGIGGQGLALPADRVLVVGRHQGTGRETVTAVTRVGVGPVEGGLTAGMGRVSELKPLDFSMLSDRQVVDLMCQVYSEIQKRREKARALAAERAGLAEIGRPKYRNPLNSAETWSGKGKMPAWLRKLLASGRDLASLEIDRDDAR